MLIIGLLGTEKENNIIPNHINGDVSKVIDGNTFCLDFKEVKLYGVHSPHLGSKFGMESRQLLDSLIQGKKITCFFIGNKALVFYMGYCVNEFMVRSGYAWVCSDCNLNGFCTKWYLLENDAGICARGIWIDPPEVRECD